MSTQQTETERLEEQRTRLISILKTNIKDAERLAKFEKMYETYGDRLIQSPASGKVHYHNAYAGGYIDHILHVYDAAVEQTKVLKKWAV